MSEITIYHNPKCSKSRATLALLESNGHTPEVIPYLEQPPDLATLHQLHMMLGLPIAEMMRTKDPEYAARNLAEADADTCLAAIAEHPALLERPIVTHRSQARIGRPPERVLELFGLAGE